jgi:hypothetical protein
MVFGKTTYLVLVGIFFSVLSNKNVKANLFLLSLSLNKSFLLPKGIFEFLKKENESKETGR